MPAGNSIRTIEMVVVATVLVSCEPEKKEGIIYIGFLRDMLVGYNFSVAKEYVKK